MMTSVASGGGAAVTSDNNCQRRKQTTPHPPAPTPRNVKSDREMGARGGVSINVKEFKIHEKMLLPSKRAKRSMINALVFFFLLFFLPRRFLLSFLPIPIKHRCSAHSLLVEVLFFPLVVIDFPRRHSLVHSVQLFGIIETGDFVAAARTAVHRQVGQS